MSNNNSSGLPKTVPAESSTLTDYVEDENFVDEFDALNDETFGGDDDNWDPDGIFDAPDDNHTAQTSTRTMDARLSDMMAAASMSAEQPFDDPAIVTCQRAPQRVPPPSKPSPPPPVQQQQPKALPMPPVSATTLEELESTFSPLSSTAPMASGLLGNSVWALTKDEEQKLTPWPEPKRIELQQPLMASNYPHPKTIPPPSMEPASSLLTCESLEKDLISFSEPPPQLPPAQAVPQPPPGLPPLPLSAMPIRLEDLEKEIMHDEPTVPQPAPRLTEQTNSLNESELPDTGDSVNPWVKRALDFEEKQRVKDQQKHHQEKPQHLLQPLQRPPMPPQPNMVPPLIRPIPGPFPRPGMPPLPLGMMPRPPFMYPYGMRGPIVHPLFPMNMFHRFGPPPPMHYQQPQHNQQHQKLFQGMQDEYAGLMTPREKDWLHKIQLMQLEGSFTDPYKEDYYSVALTAKKLEKQAKSVRPGHRDGGAGGAANNAGHPQLIVPERGARQRTESIESNNNGNARTKLKYEPLQFAGSLGKIQVSNLNRPRKLLELNALNAATDPAVLGNTDPWPIPIPSARVLANLRKLLLDIERLYLIALDIDYEDRRMAALPEAARVEHQEKRHQLCLQLFKGLLTENEQLNNDIASIRKGRTLIFRAISLLSHVPQKAFLIRQVIDRKLYTLQKPEEISLYGIDYIKLLQAELDNVNKVLPEAEKVPMPASLVASQ